jgi:hypothetical protein
MEDDDKRFTIHSDTKVRLYPIAKEWAQEHGMTLEQFARHLLDQHRLRKSGLVQRDGEN